LYRSLRDADMPTPFRIFISSPNDVFKERALSLTIVNALAKDYAFDFMIESHMWEYEPMTASGQFQDVITAPNETDIVVVILWSRLGTDLPVRTALREYRGADGRFPVTGTEWEFEDALAQFRRTGKPDIVVYRKMTEPLTSVSDEQKRRSAEAQWNSLQVFWSRYFASDGGCALAHSTFDDIDEFAR
jgi:hypothetical protein